MERRAGYLEDLYVHFTDFGFQLLRPGGGFGFIVSDTFFTLASKLRMRRLLQGTPQARELDEKAAEWNAHWLADPQIASVYRQFVTEAGGDAARPIANRVAWESAVHKLREQFKPEKLHFGRMALFRIAPQNLIATEADYRFAFDQRKAELLRHWQNRPELDAFWHDTMEINEGNHSHGMFQGATEISATDFCQLCQHVQLWVARENESRRAELRISRDAIGLRSSEDYDDPADGPRIATIYNGLSGRGRFIAFRKGDPEGSRWVDNDPLFIEWTEWVADWMFDNSGRREPNMPVVRNPGLYLTAGVT